MLYKKFKILEIMGVFICYTFAVLLHFLYDWIEGNVWGIVFGAVNESVWEHIKIFTMPYLFWGGVELAIVRVPLKRMVVGKVLGVYVLMLSIIAYFYTYTFFTGKAIFIVDIIMSFLCLAFSFFVSYKIITSKLNIELWYATSLFALILFGIMYLSFTIYPPHIDIFKDPITGNYGLAFDYGYETVKYFGRLFATYI